MDGSQRLLRLGVHFDLFFFLLLFLMLLAIKFLDGVVIVVVANVRLVEGGL